MLHTHYRGSTVPIVGVDCSFITSDGLKKRKELTFEENPEGEAALLEARRNGQLAKCIVIRCSSSNGIFSHVVPAKGAEDADYAANLVTNAVLWLGHLEAIMRGDTGPALQALIERSMRLTRIKVLDGSTEATLKRLSKEELAKYDSQSNGGTEVVVILIRGLFRRLKLCLGSHIGKFIPVGHAVVPWPLEHTCLILSVRSRGTDGITPWERVKGRPFGQQLVGFGEVALHRLPTNGPRSQPYGNIGAKQAEGVFVGYNGGSNTFTVISADGTKVEARSTTRMPEPNRSSSKIGRAHV